MEIKVDLDACTGCKLCSSACIYDAIEIEDKKAVIGDNCVFCGACIEVCKFDALEITGLKEEKKDFSQYKDVCIFLEVDCGKFLEVGKELLSIGRVLADKLGCKLKAIVLGHDIEDPNNMFEYGLDRLYMADDSLFKDNIDDVFAKAIVKAIQDFKPEIFIAGATSFGRTMIPKVAAILKT